MMWRVKTPEGRLMRPHDGRPPLKPLPESEITLPFAMSFARDMADVRSWSEARALGYDVVLVGEDEKEIG